MNKIFVKLVPVICLAAAVLFTFLGISGVKARNSYIETTAVISQIDKEYDNLDDEYDYHVFVDYTVDGKEYNTELGEYNASMKEGDEIEIKYNPEDPTEVVTSSYMSVIITFAVAVLSIAVGVISLLKRLR